MSPLPQVAESIKSSGFAKIPNVLSSSEIETIVQALERIDAPHQDSRRAPAYALRNLLEVVPEVRSMIESPKIRRIVESILGPDAFPVRGILFDKVPQANWIVPWHQDLTIAVREKRGVPGFGPWSTKAGIQHVQPPVQILEAMLAVRIHLDDCGGIYILDSLDIGRGN